MTFSDGTFHDKKFCAVGPLVRVSFCDGTFHDRSFRNGVVL